MSCFILRRICSTKVRNYSTAIQTKELLLTNEEPFQSFRTAETNPVNHNESHLNRFYTISPQTTKQLYQYGGIPKKYKELCESFTELSILVRKPALEIMEYLERTDYTRPVNKYVIYGAFGHGKSLTLAHLVHYGLMKQNLIVHVPCAANWYEYPLEATFSTSQEEIVDLPVDAKKWLIHFRNQNLPILSNLDLRLTQDYEWSEREKSEKGNTWLEMIDFGINRIKFACRIIHTLIDEIKLASTEGKFKTLVAIDGFNAFVSEFSNIRCDGKRGIHPNKISLTHAFMNLTKYDWCNGAIVVTADRKSQKERRDCDLPRYVLGEKGFEHLDPFLPVYVDKYTRDEFDTVMEYYKNRKWVREMSPLGHTELWLISNGVPLTFMEQCRSL